MLKRILSILLCFTILICSVYVFTPVNVYADYLYNTIYENFDYSDVISNHKTFTFTDKGGGKHTVFKATSTSAWVCVFGSRQVISDDTELNYYLSWYSYTGYKTVSNTFSQFLASKMGVLTAGASTLIESAFNNSSDINIDYNDNDGLLIGFDSVDKLREELKKQYYASIGMLEIKPSGNVKTLLSKSGFKAMFEETNDYNDTYARVNNYAYAFVCGYEYSSMTCYRTFFMNELPKYLYLDTTDTKGYSYSDSWYQCYRLAYYDDTSHVFSFNNSVDVYTYHYADSITPLSDMSLYYSFSRGFCYFPSFNTSDYNHSYYKEFMYFGNSSFWFFKSFEALYNYLHGSQTAYLSSKVEEKGEDITISIDDMNTNISDKMDELIDSINNKKDGMSADELQDAIDKGLENISGNIEDIKDNAEEMNNKLDSLLSIMDKQNDILLQILGVTEYIAYNTTDENGKTYEISDIQPHLMKCFTGIKNMLLYGECSFDEHVPQASSYSLNNGVNTLSDDVVVYDDDNTNYPEDVVGDYHNGILGKFPFSVPYQLYEWLQVLQCEPKVPEFTYNYGFMIGKKDDEDCIVKFDLSQYDSWAEHARSFLKLSFVLAVAVGTYHKFKGEI